MYHSQDQQEYTRTSSSLIASALWTVFRSKKWTYQASTLSESTWQSPLLSVTKTVPVFSEHSVKTHPTCTSYIQTPMFLCTNDRLHDTRKKKEKKTSITCKLLEYIVTSATMDHWKKHVQYNLHMGFRDKCSCESQLIGFMDDIVSMVHSGKKTWTKRHG